MTPLGSLRWFELGRLATVRFLHARGYSEFDPQAAAHRTRRAASPGFSGRHFAASVHASQAKAEVAVEPLSTLFAEETLQPSDEQTVAVVG